MAVGSPLPWSISPGIGDLIPSVLSPPCSRNWGPQVLSMCLWSTALKRLDITLHLPRKYLPASKYTAHLPITFGAGDWRRHCVLEETARLTISLQQYLHVSVTQPCLTLQPYGLQPARLLRPWDSPGKNTAVGCQFLLRGIFPTQGSNLGSPALQEAQRRSILCAVLPFKLVAKAEMSSEQNGSWTRMVRGSSAEHLRSVWAPNLQDLLFLLAQVIRGHINLEQLRDWGVSLGKRTRHTFQLHVD